MLAPMLDVLPVELVGLRQRLGETLGERLRLLGRVRPRQQDCELVAAEPGDNVAGAHCRAQAVGDRLQQRVADPMAQRVVDDP